MPADLELRLYDKAMHRTAWLGDPQAVQIIPRHLAVGSLVVVVPNNHPKLPELTSAGARIVADYHGDTLLSGVLRSIEGEGGREGTVTCTFESDERLLWRMLGWPVPGSPLNAQGTKQDVRNGAAETVLKGFIGANAARLGLPVTIAEDQERGSSFKLGIRMTPLGEALQPKLITSGIGFTVRQQGETLEVDCYETQAYGRLLNETSGIVQAWGWSASGPSLTRAVVAGQGEGTAREFTLVSDPTAEADWGDIIEGFVDARDLEDAGDLPARGEEALTEGRAIAGLAVELSETTSFRYGQAVNVGDTVELEVGPSITVSDVLAEAVLNWDRETGFTAVPVVGERSDDPSRTLMQKLAQITRTVRKLTTI